MTQTPSEPEGVVGSEGPDDLTETTIPDSTETDPDVPLPSQDPDFADEGEESDDGDVD